MSTPSHSTAALLSGDAFGEHVVARLLDFTANTTPWQRRLWDLGTVLALREVHEAGQWLDAQVISEAALRWFCRVLERLVGRDRGVGESEVRRQLRDTLQADLSEHSRHRRRLDQLINLINEGYLDRWAAAANSPAGVSAERLSRAVACHLLDCGYSPGFLHRTFRIMTEGINTVGDLLAKAAELANATPRHFEVLVPFTAVPQYRELAEGLPEWRSAAQVRAWFAVQSPGNSIRQTGAFLYSIEALDPYAAARRAGEFLDRLLARSSYTRRKRSGLEPVGRVWVGGLGEPLPLRLAARGVDVLSLERERTLYQIIERNLLDDALELAAPLNSGTPGPAVAGSWAALESLLYHPGDEGDRKEGRAIAATRLAALVTCSWPRAELTALSYRHKPASPDLLAQQLAKATTNRERAIAVASALQAGRPIETELPADAAAAARMAGVVAMPRQSLNDIRVVIEGSLRRLYRQRNIVLHGGSTQSVALNSTLHTAAPLVGAGLDRITHAFLVDEVSPLDLAAKAELRLRLVGEHGSPTVTDLLE
jgi:hypothetical protein